MSYVHALSSLMRLVTLLRGAYFRSCVVRERLMIYRVVSNDIRERGVAYWAIQAGLLTPLTFARHRLSPLAVFTSGAYFLHNGRR